MGTGSFNSPIAVFSTAGSLASAPGPGTIAGTLDFSDVPGTTVANTVPSFITVSDGSGGNFVFDVSSVTTVSFTSQVGVHTAFGLYLLGSAVDSSLGLTPGATSVTITSNQTGSSAYSASASLAAPPAGIVEPAAWALMLLGFGLTGGAIRTRVKAVARAA
jgi:hypothetical protein